LKRVPLKAHNGGHKRLGYPEDSMTFHPMSRPDAEKGEPHSDEKASLAEDNLALQSGTDVNLLARMLAAAGGGPVSQDLALDLVLNEVVAQARKATRASGAAIALARDGRMICRATTGNAPDLGVRVETDSGISGACLITGNIQLCSDTDVDPRVNAEACRRLNVRSMLMVPISDGKHNFGIVEVFAAPPNAFNEEDIKALQVLAQSVATSKKASDEGLVPEAKLGVASVAQAESPEVLPTLAGAQEPEPPSFAVEEPDKREFLTSVLVVLVIAVAIVLGVVIGVGVMPRKAGRTPVQSGSVSAKNPTERGMETSSRASVPASGAPTESRAADSAAQKPPSSAAAEPPVGGLIVTQNGKVIYRSDSAPGEGTVDKPRPYGRLIHRVNPTYPEAARSQHIQGPVILNAHVLGDGSVGEIEVVTGHPLLAEAATRAVKQWKFQSYSVNGQPVERQERITVRFTLPSS
jgi:TonB family protein